MGYFKKSDRKDAFVFATVTQANPNLLAGTISATCFDSKFHCLSNKNWEIIISKYSEVIKIFQNR